MFEIEIVDEVGRLTTYEGGTDAGAWIYYKLAFGSGELINFLLSYSFFKKSRVNRKLIFRVSDQV